MLQLLRCLSVHSISQNHFSITFIHLICEVSIHQQAQRDGGLSKVICMCVRLQCAKFCKSATPISLSCHQQHLYAYSSTTQQHRSKYNLRVKQFAVQLATCFALFPKRPFNLIEQNAAGVALSIRKVCTSICRSYITHLCITHQSTRHITKRLSLER